MLIYPIFLPQIGCPFRCIFCNQYLITRTESFNYHNIELELQNFYTRNSTKTYQIAFFGGTFTNLHHDIQLQLLQLANKYLTPNSTIRISTRPDAINNEILEILLKNNVSTIELGMQSLDDNVLKKSKRGYLVKQVIDASNLIKEKGFILGGQLMPGLPGFSENSLQTTINILQKIEPKYLRIYPTLVIKNTKLADLYFSDKYQPLTIDQAIESCTKIIKSLKNYDTEIIKIGLHSDVAFENDSVIAGPFHHAFGELVKARILSDEVIQKSITVQNFDTIVFSDRDRSLLMGHKKKYFIKLKEFFYPEHKFIVFDKKLTKMEFIFK